MNPLALQRPPPYSVRSPAPLATEPRRKQQLRCLSSDEAQFIDAAFERILPHAGITAWSSLYVDSKLLRHDLDDARRAISMPRPAILYKAGIEAVQAHCLRVYGERFQQLCTTEQDAVLALLRESPSPGGITQFQTLASVLFNDAAESYFHARWR